MLSQYQSLSFLLSGKSSFFTSAVIPDQERIELQKETFKTERSGLTIQLKKHEEEIKHCGKVIDTLEPGK